MIRLKPMSQQEFEAYLEWATSNYAQEQVRAGAWPEESAHELSQKTYAGFLPEGLSTPYQYLYTIEREKDGANVGQLWWGIQVQGESRFATLNDFRILEEHRRQGYGRAALEAMENQMQKEGLATVFLHVFGHNEAARAMYKKLGYVERNITMVKDLQA